MRPRTATQFIVFLTGLVALLALASVATAQSTPPISSPFTPSATAGYLVLAAEPDPIPEKVPAAGPRPEKRKAGFLAAGGLVVLSLLVLAAGLALVRAFRRR